MMSQKQKNSAQNSVASYRLFTCMFGCNLFSSWCLWCSLTCRFKCCWVALSSMNLSSTVCEVISKIQIWGKSLRMWPQLYCLLGIRCCEVLSIWSNCMIFGMLCKVSFLFPFQVDAHRSLIINWNRGTLELPTKDETRHHSSNNDMVACQTPCSKAFVPCRDHRTDMRGHQ